MNEGVVCIVFDGPPGVESGRFVEVENGDGKSVQCGQWVERPDGLWALVITAAEVEEVAT